MKLKYDAYLAGAMHGRLGRDVLTERENARNICAQLGLKPYDPSEDEFVKAHQIIDIKPTLKRMKRFVKKDVKNLDRCKAIVVLTGDKSSAGTAWEMARMHYKHKRPIVLIAPRMHDKMLVNFTTILATKICATQLQAFRWLKRRLK